MVTILDVFLIVLRLFEEIGFSWCFPVSILHKSIAGHYRPVRVTDGPITARCRFMKNASWVDARCVLPHPLTVRVCTLCP